VAEQRLRAADIEQADLLATYRSVVQEKRRMETDLGSMSTEKVKEGASQQQLREQLEQARSSLSAHSQMEARWTAERLALRAQTESLNERLVRLQEKLETVESDNRRMMQDSFGLQQTNAMLNERVQLVIRRATAATDANKVLTARLSSAEREREAVRALVQIERQRATEMGAVAEEARTLAATKEVQLQRFRSTVRSGGSQSGESPSPQSSNDSSASRSNSNSPSLTAAAASTIASDMAPTEVMHQN
jgi:chromosome segregation ATPase